MSKQLSMEWIEDRTFENLIKRYTAEREWGILTLTFFIYGDILEGREAAA